jgi:periplasmic protein TonB
MFEASLVNDAARTARPYTVSLSLAMQIAAAAAAVCYPLWHIEALPIVKLRVTSPFRRAIELVDPRPVQAAPPSVATPRRTLFHIPIPRRPEDFAAPSGPQLDMSQLDLGPIGPSTPGLGLGANTGGGPIVFERPNVKPVPPVEVTKPIPPPSAPVRPGGNVKPPLLLKEIKPAYPSLAVSARVQGTVRIEAIISRDGFVRDARVVSGHPLLVAAALDAVRQWRYRPTILNDQPVEVALALEVHFTLSR